MPKMTNQKKSRKKSRVSHDWKKRCEFGRRRHLKKEGDIKKEREDDVLLRCPGSSHLVFPLDIDTTIIDLIVLLTSIERTHLVVDC